MAVTPPELLKEIAALDRLDGTRVIMAVAERLVMGYAAAINSSTDPMRWSGAERTRLICSVQPVEVEAALVRLRLKKPKKASPEAVALAEIRHRELEARKASIVRGVRKENVA